MSFNARRKSKWRGRVREVKTYLMPFPPALRPCLSEQRSEVSDREESGSLSEETETWIMRRNEKGSLGTQARLRVLRAKEPASRKEINEPPTT